MKKATIFHNPGAGDEEHGERAIIRMAESLGYHCKYLSTKENFKDKVGSNNELFIIAGGDGTVRKLCKKFLLNAPFNQVPLCLLPKGTANNIAYTLGVRDSERQARAIIKQHKQLSFDVWNVQRIPGVSFFVEALGFGLFPTLIKEMRQLDDIYRDEPEKKLGLAKDKLHILSHELPMQRYEIYADGKNYSGDYLMVELMNIKSIGPNLILSKEANPCDGMLDLVLFGKEDREKLCKHLKAKSSGKRSAFKPNIISAKKIDIVTEEKLCHADDELIELNRAATIKVRLGKTPLNFLIP